MKILQSTPSLGYSAPSSASIAPPWTRTSAIVHPWQANGQGSELAKTLGRIDLDLPKDLQIWPKTSERGDMSSTASSRSAPRRRRGRNKGNSFGIAMERFSRAATSWTGSTTAIVCAFGLVLVWVLLGPRFPTTRTPGSS